MCIVPKHKYKNIIRLTVPCCQLHVMPDTIMLILNHTPILSHFSNISLQLFLIPHRSIVQAFPTGVSTFPLFSSL